MFWDISKRARDDTRNTRGRRSPDSVAGKPTPSRQSGTPTSPLSSNKDQLRRYRTFSMDNRPYRWKLSDYEISRSRLARASSLLHYTLLKHAWLEKESGLLNLTKSTTISCQTRCRNQSSERGRTTRLESLIRCLFILYLCAPNCLIWIIYS